MSIRSDCLNDFPKFRENEILKNLITTAKTLDPR